MEQILYHLLLYFIAILRLVIYTFVKKEEKQNAVLKMKSVRRIGIPSMIRLEINGMPDVTPYIFFF